MTEWNSVMRDIEYVPVTHVKSFIEYQNCYHGEPDTSRVVYENKYPIALFPGKIGDVVHQPIFVKAVSEKIQKKVINQILEEFPTGTYSDVFLNDFGISLWHRMLLDIGAISEVKYELFLDVDLTFDEIWKTFRKSYRSLINQYEAKCLVAIDDDMESFRKMHFEIAGKETRSKETWDLQQKSISDGQAFAMKIDFGKLTNVGRAFFDYSPHECLYSVAVYNRFFTEQGIPLGHILLWNAINKMQEMKLRYFKLGDYVINGTDKERAISQFKIGFASHIFPKYILEIY